MSNKARVRAYLVPEAALKGNRMLTYGEICDGEREIVPVTMRAMHGHDGYQVLEDVDGNVYIIKNKTALAHNLDKMPLGVVESSYMAPPQAEKPVEEVVEDEPVSEESLEQSESNIEEIEESEGEENE